MLTNFLKRSPSFRPSHGVQINRGHRLAQGLHNCILWNDDCPFDLQTGLQLTAVNGRSSVAVKWGGVGVGSVDSRGYHFYQNIAPGSTRAFTIATYYQPHTSVIAPMAFYSEFGASLVNFNADSPPAMVARVRDGDNTTLAEVTLSSNLPLDVPHLLVASWGNGVTKGYLDGVLKGTSTAANDHVSTNGNLRGQEAAVGNEFGANRQWHFADYSWQRELNESEVAELWADPYAMFQQGGQLLFSEAASLGGVPFVAECPAVVIGFRNHPIL